MKRQKMSKQNSSRVFKKGMKTQKINIAPRTARGGIRL